MTKSNEVNYVGLKYIVSLDSLVGLMVLTGENDQYKLTIEQFTNKVINGSIQANE